MEITTPYELSALIWDLLVSSSAFWYTFIFGILIHFHFRHFEPSADFFTTPRSPLKPTMIHGSLKKQAGPNVKFNQTLYHSEIWIRILSNASLGVFAYSFRHINSSMWDSIWQPWTPSIFLNFFFKLRQRFSSFCVWTPFSGLRSFCCGSPFRERNCTGDACYVEITTPFVW